MIAALGGDAADTTCRLITFYISSHSEANDGTSAVSRLPVARRDKTPMSGCRSPMVMKTFVRSRI